MAKRELVREIGAIVAIGGGVFLLLCLYSFHPQDPSFNLYQPVPSQIHNLGGLIGAYLSDILWQVFGCTSFLFPLVLLIIGISAFVNRTIEPKGTWWVGFCLLLISTSALLDILIGEVKVFSYDHKGLKPPIMTETEKKYGRRPFGEFTLFVGDKGLIGTDSRIIPEEKHKAFPSPPKTIPRAHGGPISDLFHAIRNNGTPCSNFIDSAGPLTAFALTGHLAMFAGQDRKLEWDVEKMQVTNMPEINKYVARTYRKGWEL